MLSPFLLLEYAMAIPFHYTPAPSIQKFDGYYAFLSNFWICNIQYEGETYSSVEHAYVAAKTTDPFIREQIRASGSPGQVKRFGRSIVLRPNWNEIRIPTMRALVAQKFQDEELRTKLLATGVAALIEGNHWGDRFWGVYQGQGENHLGRILMEVRALALTKSLFPRTPFTK